MNVTPASIARRPKGAPAAQGGQFTERRNSPPAGILPGNTSPQSERASELEAAYRALWRRVNAKHRGIIYGESDTLAATSADPAELAVLAHFAKPGIAEQVARNPATPPEVLHHLAISENEVRTDECRRSAVLHPNCDPETIRIVWAHRNTPLFPGRAAGVVRQAPNCPPDIRTDESETKTA